MRIKIGLPNDVMEALIKEGYVDSQTLEDLSKESVLNVKSLIWI